MKTATLQAPFPYAGGKSPVASEVWKRFGNAKVYLEPFVGSGAVLLARPPEHLSTNGNRYEYINDADGFITNAFRAIKFAPEAVAKYADWPVS